MSQCFASNECILSNRALILGLQICDIMLLPGCSYAIFIIYIYLHLHICGIWKVGGGPHDTQQMYPQRIKLIYQDRIPLHLIWQSLVFALKWQEQGKPGLHYFFSLLLANWIFLPEFSLFAHIFSHSAEKNLVSAFSVESSCAKSTRVMGRHFQSYYKKSYTIHFAMFFNIYAG